MASPAEPASSVRSPASAMASAARSISSSRGSHSVARGRRARAHPGRGSAAATPAPLPAPCSRRPMVECSTPSDRAAPGQRPARARRQEIPQLIPVDVPRPAHGHILGHRPVRDAPVQPRPALGVLGESTASGRSAPWLWSRRAIRRAPCTSSREFQDMTGIGGGRTALLAAGKRVRVLVRTRPGGSLAPARARRWPSPRWTTPARWQRRSRAPPALTCCRPRIRGPPIRSATAGGSPDASPGRWRRAGWAIWSCCPR